MFFTLDSQYKSQALALIRLGRTADSLEKKIDAVKASQARTQSQLDSIQATVNSTNDQVGVLNDRMQYMEYQMSGMDAKLDALIHAFGIPYPAEQ